MDDDDLPGSGEVDYDWVEQQVLEQQLSLRFAAQRDEDEEEFVGFEDEEEEPPEEDEEPSMKGGNQDKRQQQDVNRSASSTSTAANERTVDFTESNFAVRPNLSSKPRIGRCETRPYDEYFLRYPLLGQRQTTITLGSGQRLFCGFSAASNSKVGSGTRSDRAKQATTSNKEKRWTTKFDSKTFSKLEGDVELKLAVERKSAEVVESQLHTLPRKQQPPEEAQSRIPLVRKYMPTKFIDLLSHERKNRDALKWLRSFDKTPVEGAPPIPKVLLLAGPPGSGKTTMAHVLARHAGYRVVEINASDERSASGLKEKLSSATEMKSVFDQDGRYNLVVLDEVDGVSDGVQAVVQYATSPANTKPLICTCNDAYALALRPLRRISLVLNVALPSRARLVKRLREICQLENVDYRPGALEMLVGRMDEDVRASLNALDFWMRSYRFQDLEGTDSSSSDSPKTRPRLILDVESVRRLPTFAKDGTADLWATWKKILHRGAATSSGASLGNDRLRQGRPEKNEDLLTSVSRHVGDLDLMVDGIHENFLRNRFTDPAFTKTHKAYEWLSFVDVMQTRCMRELDFSFTSYCAVGLVGVGRSVNGGSSGKLVFPSAASAFRNTRMRNMEALDGFFENPGTRTLSRREFPVETVSILLHVLTPCIRPIPVQALSFEEKREVDRVVELMDELGLSWMEDTDSMMMISSTLRRDVAPLWSLDPPIDKLTTFGNQRLCGKLSPELARGVNIRLKKSSSLSRKRDNGQGFREIVSSSSTATATMSKNSSETSATIEEVGRGGEPQAKRLKGDTEAPTQLTEPSKSISSSSLKLSFDKHHGPPVKRDFFGRVIAVLKQPEHLDVQKSSSCGRSKQHSGMMEKHEFTFRFNEGLTDAVRRVVKMQDLL